MPRVILLVPTSHGVGLTSTSLGLVAACERQGVRVGFCKAIAQDDAPDPAQERSSALVRLGTGLVPPVPLARERAEALLGAGDEQRLLEEIVARLEPLLGGDGVVIIEGLAEGDRSLPAAHINQALARTFDADVVLVGSGRGAAGEVAEAVAIAARGFDHDDERRVLGVVLNRVPADAVPTVRAALLAHRLALVGAFPLVPELGQPRIADLVRCLRPEVLVAGDTDRRIARVIVLAQSLPGALHSLIPGSLLITPGDRHDIIAAVALAALGGKRFAGLLLSAGVRPDPAVVDLVRPAQDTGLPLLLAVTNTYDTATAVNDMDREVAPDDRARVQAAMALADHFDPAWVLALVGEVRERRLSPPAFRHQLIERARRANRRIVLPEGDEPRTIRAAVTVQERGIARCVLLAKPEAVQAQARTLGLTLPDGLETIDPATIAERYVAPLVEARKAKGMTEARAREELSDSIVVGTMMLKLGEVDGLVSGAVHTTAHTIRPALQLIKTAPGSSLVSSVFFMCLPDQVVVYGDCAVNPDPTAEQLADIALQSADSARAFGIEPRVAMISYSTGASGSGSDVDKVREATRLARARRSDLAIDGPLQYDAAATLSVARTKLPDSAVAGHATVFVFPDLNTGNTTYKAVQRSAQVVSIGPMLQGLAKPVNDLSRGALVEDIVYTIALTAIQAGQNSAVTTAT
jgi:phosphate acetyltransferase